MITDAMRECAARTDRRWRGWPDQSLLDFLLESRPSRVSMAHHHSLLSVECTMTFAPLFEFQLDGKETLDADWWKVERVFTREFYMRDNSSSNPADGILRAIPSTGWLTGGALWAMVECICVVLGVACGWRPSSTGMGGDGDCRKNLWVMNEGSSASEHINGMEWAKVVGEPALKPSATELTSRCAGLLAYGPDLRQRRVIMILNPGRKHWVSVEVAFDGTGIEVTDGYPSGEDSLKAIGVRAEAMAVQLCCLAGRIPVPAFPVRAAPLNGQRQEDGQNCGFIALLDVAERLVGNSATASTADAGLCRCWVWNNFLELSTMKTELDGVSGCGGAPALQSIMQHLSHTWSWCPPVILNTDNDCATMALFQVLVAVPGLASSVVSSSQGSDCEVTMAFRESLITVQSIEGEDAHMDVVQLHSALLAAAQFVPREALAGPRTRIAVHAGGGLAVAPVEPSRRHKGGKKKAQASPGHHDPLDLLAVLAKSLRASEVYDLGNGVLGRGSVCGACKGMWAVHDSKDVYSVELALPQVQGASPHRPHRTAAVTIEELLVSWGEAQDTEVACGAPDRGGDAQQCVYGGLDSS